MNREQLRTPESEYSAQKHADVLLPPASSEQAPARGQMSVSPATVRAPAGLWQRMRLLPSTREFILARDLLRELVVRDMKVRYKRSALGFIWSMLNPLLQLLVLYFVFSLLLPRNIPNYPAYLFTGLLAYGWFQGSVLQGAYSISGNRELIRRPGFTMTILPVVTTLTNLIHFLLSLPVLLAVLILGGSEPTAAIAALPLLMMIEFLVIIGLTYLVAGANVIFHDIEHLLPIVIRLLFFLTPIFYGIEIIPAEVLPIYRLNPLVNLIVAYRDILIEGTLPDWSSLLWPCLFGLVFFVIGYKVFMRINYRFVDEL